MKYHDNLLILSKEKGLSLAFLSNKLGKDKSNLSMRISKGYKIQDDELEKLAELLGVSFDYLVGETNDKKEAPVKLTRRTKKLIKIYDALPADKQALLDTLLEQFARDEGIDSANDD